MFKPRKTKLYRTTVQSNSYRTTVQSKSNFCQPVKILKQQDEFIKKSNQDEFIVPKGKKYRDKLFSDSKIVDLSDLEYINNAEFKNATEINAPNLKQVDSCINAPNATLKLDRKNFNKIKCGYYLGKDRTSEELKQILKVKEVVFIDDGTKYMF